jgi:hypothetical protein
MDDAAGLVAGDEAGGPAEAAGQGNQLGVAEAGGFDFHDHVGFAVEGWGGEVAAKGVGLVEGRDVDAFHGGGTLCCHFGSLGKGGRLLGGRRVVF